MPEFYAADVAEVFAHFGIRPAQEQSCYPWSPVFPATWQGQQVVLKHAAKRMPDPIAAWCRHLSSLGVRVVTPVELPTPNPGTVADQNWVVYPWVSGRPYDGTPSDIAAAGDLLGRLHAAADPDKPLAEFNWLDYPPAEADSDLAKLRDRFDRHAPGDADRLIERLRPLTLAFERVTRPAMKDATLPIVSACMDYKATNLVFTPDGPVLIDPDGAVQVPRLLDLAFAALMFHTEQDGAPGRPFGPTEWQVFLDAYLAHVALTDVERQVWPDAIDYILCDEGIWAITDSTEWHVERQRSFLLALAGTSRDAYPL